MPIESTMVKPMAVEPAAVEPAAPANTTNSSNVVDYTSRSKPLPANTASLRNDRTATGSGKNERPARADRN